MKCFLQGVAGFIACGLVVALFLPSFRAGGAYYPKKVPIKVRVIDADSRVPVADAIVSFFPTRNQSIADVAPPSNSAVPEGASSAETDKDGYAEVIGTFRATDNRRGGPFHRNDAWYHLSGEWLKVVAPGRPPAYVWLNGHGFAGERDYDNDQPLEVVVVMTDSPSE